MAEFKMAAIIKLSENEWVWVRLNQFESEVRMQWECFWVNLREDNKLSESKMAVSESNRAEFKMAAIIKLSQKESVKFFFVQNSWIHNGRNSRWLPSSSWVRMSEFESDWTSLSQGFFAKWLNPTWQIFKMATIIRLKLSQNESVKFFFVQNSWIHNGRIQDGCHHQVELEWMSFSQIELVWVRVLCKMAESKMAEFNMEEFKMVAIIKLIRWN